MPDSSVTMMSDTDGNSPSSYCLRVTVTSGPHAGQVAVWFEPGRYLIGRSTQSHVPLVHDLLVSPEHCCLELNERGCILEDLGSRHGTLVNGHATQRSLLQSGDQVKIGMSELKISTEEVSALAPTILRRGSRSSDFPSAVPAECGLQRLTIPGYDIVRQIGAGGMGIVYEARHRATGKRVALKTILPAAGGSPQAIPLFLREVSVLSQLVHPRIVRFIEAGEHQRQIFLAMEYVPTIPLQETVSQFPVERRTAVYCGIVCQVLKALDYAHSLGLVHRDVKPQNILISQVAGSLQSKLADFGLAKNYHLAGLSRLTKDGEVRGTLAFMPDEQFLDSRYAKPSADIYAAGATLHWYLAGVTPRSGSQRLSSRSPPPSHSVPLRMLRPDLPADLIDVIEQSLAADPRDRFSTAGEFRIALKCFAAF